MELCIERIEPVAVLASLVLGVPLNVRRSGLPCRDAVAIVGCMACLSEALHDAADLVEGAAERITPRPAPESPG